MSAKTIIPFLAFLLLAPIAFAGNIETDNFFEKGTNSQVTGVGMLVYTCTDNNEQCVTVIQPEVIRANSGNTNTVTVQYPGTANPTDYAEYFFKSGFLPLAFVVPDDSGTGLTFVYDNFFEKGQNCRSPVDSFTIQNTINANEPVQLNVRTGLDATTHSAFRDSGIPPFFVPQELKDEHYSAQTAVTLTIKDTSGTIIHTETKNVNLFMDTKQDVQFTWTPTTSGNGFTAEISTNVIDNQCSSSVQQKTSKQFSVLPARPTNECYVILNDLAPSTPSPRLNELLTISYTKISNFADQNSVKTAVPMNATHTIKNASGTVVFNQTVTLQATSTDTPAQQNFVFTPNATGSYSITIAGKSQSSLCNGITNREETIISEFVVEQVLNDILFTVRDLVTTQPISGATVTIGSKTNTTTSAGKATLNDFAPGIYTYTISHPDYKTLTDTVQVGLADVSVDAQLSKQNRAPRIALDSIDPLTLTAGSTRTVDFNEFVSDDDDTKGSLTLFFRGNNIISITIEANKQVVFRAPNTATTETVTFTTRDPSGAEASDTLTIAVNAGNSAPTLDNLPDVTLDEDEQRSDVFNLRNFASDTETAKADLTYNLSANTCGASLDSNDNVDIQPTPNFNGQCTVTATATDTGGLSDTDTFIVIIRAVNDAPKIDSFPPPTAAAVGVQYNYTVKAFDVEGDTLTFSLTTAPNGMGINSATGAITWTPAANQLGNNAVTVRVSDGQSTDSQSFTVVVSGRLNSPPVLNAIGNKRGRENQLLQFTVSASDADKDILTFTATNLPRGATFGGQTFSWTPDSTQAGTFVVTFTVSDGNGGVASEAITITIDDENAPVVVVDGAAPKKRENIGLIFNKIRLVSGEFAQAGDTLELNFQLNNNRDIDLEDVKITATVPEWGIRRSVGPFDIDEDDSVTRSIVFDIPDDITPGEYDIRITASNDRLVHVTHRVITIE